MLITKSDTHIIHGAQQVQGCPWRPQEATICSTKSRHHKVLTNIWEATRGSQETQGNTRRPLNVPRGSAGRPHCTSGSPRRLQDMPEDHWGPQLLRTPRPPGGPRKPLE
eukprot:8242193-Pyramimonas_sp.AAC.1